LGSIENSGRGREARRDIKGRERKTGRQGDGGIPGGFYSIYIGSHATQVVGY